MKACDHIWLFKWFTLACCMSHTYPKRKYVFLMGTLMIIIGCSIKAFIASNIHILTYAGALIILWYVLVNVTLSIIEAKK